MTKPRITVFDKPQWFDLDNYKSAEDLSVDYWFLQLVYRQYLYSNLGKSIKEAGMDLQRQINHLIEEPIFRISGEVKNESDKREKEYKNHIEEIRGDSADLYQDTISPLTCFRVHQLLFYLPTRLKNFFEDRMPLTDETRHKEHYAYRLVDDTLAKRESHLFPSHVYPQSIKYISVDLNAPTEKIIDDFTNYLVAARSRYQLREGSRLKLKRKGYDKPQAIKQLIEHRVLQYLDLKIWYMYQQIDITQDVLGEWIFPDIDLGDVSKKIAKYTAPYAKRAITAEFLSTLRLL